MLTMQKSSPFMDLLYNHHCLLARDGSNQYYPLMKINLVSCCLEEGNLSYPLGALCIQSAIMSHPKLAGHDCIHFPFTLSHDPKRAADAVCESKAEVIGLSVYLWNRDWFDAFTQQIAANQSKALLFCGGPEVTANPCSFDLEQYHFLVLGEGEHATTQALVQLLDGLSIEGDGLVTKYKASTTTVPPDVEKLESVLLSGLADRFLTPGASVLWEMTRGCPFNCSFCFESRGNRTVRNFPGDRLKQELDYLMKHHVGEVYVLDPTFNLDKARTTKLLSLLVESQSEIHFVFELRAELLDEDLADMFAKLNCALQIGLQSSSKEVLSASNRRFDPTLFAAKIELLNARGIPFGLDLIIGLPQDSFARFCSSLDYALLLKPSNIDIFPLSMLPGTQVADEASLYHIEHLPKAPYTIIQSPTFSKEEIAKALALKQACDLFFTKGQAGMWMHALCDATNLKPSAILTHFSSFCSFAQKRNHLDIEQTDIYELQEMFVRTLLAKLGRQHLLDALLSFIELHQGISFCHETGQIPVVELSYDLDLLAMLDKIPIERFVKKHRPLDYPIRYAIQPNDDGTLAFVEQKESY